MQPWCVRQVSGGARHTVRVQASSPREWGQVVPAVLKFIIAQGDRGQDARRLRDHRAGQDGRGVRPTISNFNKAVRSSSALTADQRKCWARKSSSIREVANLNQSIMGSVRGTSHCAPRRLAGCLSAVCLVRSPAPEVRPTR